MSGILTLQAGLVQSQDLLWP